MSTIITRDYQGHVISYQADGWFNATAAAAKWGKAPAEWLRLPSTIEYIAAVAKHNPSMGKTHRSKSGPAANGGGTWLHPKLAVPFSRWLDAEFAVWCDAQIDGLIRGKDNWRVSRHASASGFKVAADILKMVRDDAGKDTKPYHYSNEARLVNWAMTDKFDGIDRDTLSADDLDMLAYLQERNAVLIGRGLDYEHRKPIIKQYAMDKRLQLHCPPPALLGLANA